VVNFLDIMTENLEKKAGWWTQRNIDLALGKRKPSKI
jgi:hypothetical protein